MYLLILEAGKTLIFNTKLAVFETSPSYNIQYCWFQPPYIDACLKRQIGQQVLHFVGQRNRIEQRNKGELQSPTTVVHI